MQTDNLAPINLSALSDAERSVIVLFRAGKDTAEIARLMKLSGGEAEAERLLRSARDKGRMR